MSRLFISATRKSSGKTTVALGICAALSVRGLKVQAFKKGPDYIDPMWLSRSSGRPCINLDFNTMSPDELLETLSRYQSSADLSIIEGNKGLYDGVDTFGADSNAALCKLTGTPVVLVVDAEGSTRGVAPLVLGYQQFDPDIIITGVIFNKTGGHRHETKLRRVMEHYTDVQVLGCVPKSADISMSERHLGLITDREVDTAGQYVERIREVVEQCINVDLLTEIAAPVIQSEAHQDASSSLGVAAKRNKSRDPIRIGVARDRAFCFYYHDDLEVMENSGAEIQYFDTLNDKVLPDVDALFIGGGFPETHCEELEGNLEMRQAIKAFAAQGKLIYAECGGLMYLTRQINWQGKTSAMVGLIPADTQMCDRPVGRGYVQLVCERKHPWGRKAGPTGVKSLKSSGTSRPSEVAHGKKPVYGDEIRAHEFHYSRLNNIDDGVEYAYRVQRGHGIDGVRDGLVVGSVLANYTHMRHSEENPWVSHFMSAIRKNKSHANAEKNIEKNVKKQDGFVKQNKPGESHGLTRIG